MISSMITMLRIDNCFNRLLWSGFNSIRSSKTPFVTASHPSIICFIQNHQIHHHRHCHTRTFSSSSSTTTTTTTTVGKNSIRDKLDLTFSDTEQAYRSKTTFELIRAIAILYVSSFDTLVFNHDMV